MGKVVSLGTIDAKFRKTNLILSSRKSKRLEMYQSFLHSDITWELHGQEVSVIHGIDDYLLKIQQTYHQSNVQFSCLHTFSTNENRIVTILKNDFSQLSCDILSSKMV